MAGRDVTSVAAGTAPPGRSADVEAEELSGLVRRGVGWMMASQGAIQVMALLTSIVIAHFLSPRQVGLASEAVVFVSLTLTLGDMGVGSVIVQRARLSQLEISSLFWAGIGVGLALTLLGVAVSPLVADLYGEPKVEPLFAVMALTFVITAPGIVQGALMTKELRFRSLELRTIAATVTSCTTGIALAALGAGPWAIVTQTILMAGTSTLLLWRSSPWRPALRCSLTALREFREYAGHILGARLVGWANNNLDNLMVGRFLGASLLGAYSLAFSVALTPVNRVAGPVTQVFFPAFSQMREPDRIAPVWLRATRILAFVVVPVLAGLIVVAPDLVEVVFGRRWRHAAPVMQLLAGVALLQTLSALNDPILQALAQTRLLLRIRTAVSATTLVTFGIGTIWGINGAATGYLAACLVLHPIYILLTTRTVGISLLAWLRSVSRVGLVGAVMVGVLLAVRHLYVAHAVPALIRLLTLMLIGGLVYAALIVVFVPPIVGEIQAVMRRRRRVAAA